MACTGSTTQEQPARIVRRYVALPDGQVHVHERAGCEPAIVFLHQTASSARSFDPLLAALRLPNRLLSIDMPGFGGSFDPEGQPEMSDYAGWMRAVCDGLNVAAAHLFGHHTGATLAVEMAQLSLHRVLSVTMMGPVFMTAGERAEFEAGYDQPIRPRRGGEHLQENWDYAARFNPDCPVELLHDEVVAMLRAWRGRAQAYRAVARHDTARRSSGLAAPVLLLTSPDDFFHATFGRAVALFPSARTAVVGGGNFQPSADAAGVARALEDFIGQM